MKNLKDILPLIILLTIVAVVVYFITKGKGSRSYYDERGNYIGSDPLSAPQSSGNGQETSDTLDLDNIEDAEAAEENDWLIQDWDDWLFGTDHDYIGGYWNPVNWF